MRYSNVLHTAKQHNILKNRWKSSAISWLWLIFFIVTLSFLINFSNLSISDLLGGFGVSLIRTTIAYIFAITIAVVTALLITTSKLAETIFLPVLDVLQSFPSFALFPLLVVAMKNSPETIIISVLALEMVWPILFSIIGGIKNRREDLEEAATIFRARGWKRLTHFIFPELWPAIVTGSIVGWGEGWEFIIGAELLVKTHLGIGAYLGVLGNQQNNVGLAFGITILLMLLFIINKIIWLPLLNRSTLYSAEG